MIESLLIANRGEIARRIIRTARRLGVRTIAVFSAADAHAPFVAEADEAIAIGAAPVNESYLCAPKIIEAARQSRATAIHPGYGFLSENAEFADAVLAAGLIWVGAPPAAIRAMGRKDAAKALMIKAGVPVTPGFLGESQSVERLAAEAHAIGYPVLIKAVAGGGGKGMRRVDDQNQFAEALAACRREAASAFGDDRVLLEKYILAPRHIEVQVFGDTAGQIVHLFERDCSLQRRHQKVIEEAPAPGMDSATRAALCAVAVQAAQAVGYVGAGTVEFIADASTGLRADRIWFMEMNTRLQVEHGVTEAITGVDLVEWQLRIASGEALPRRQHELEIEGCAMEARLYAENPNSGFLPCTGHLRHVRLPADIRVDSGIEEGGEVSGFYDPMIAKLIVHAANRAAAARAMSAACAQIEIWPVRTNAAFLCRVAADPSFVAGEIDTGFIERRAEFLIPPEAPNEAIVRAAARALLPEAASDPWSALPGFRANAPPYDRVDVVIGGRIHSASIESALEPAPHPAAPAASVRCIDGESVLFLQGEAWAFAAPASERAAGAVTVSDGSLRSPMPGRIVSVAVAQGQRVSKGATILALEAMKMEHALIAPFNGIVVELSVAAGDQVPEGMSLARIAGES
ncbi:MAG TPA: biotin carboxylase N-terminal domain-containing protein [Steroidobacteraceae bacterium]|nr:biotin carboxylase N-terminal domain-containing protein [Steroidobacteraceae bacterium]